MVDWSADAVLHLVMALSQCLLQCLEASPARERCCSSPAFVDDSSSEDGRGSDKGYVDLADEMDLED